MASHAACAGISLFESFKGGVGERAVCACTGERVGDSSRSAGRYRLATNAFGPLRHDELIIGPNGSRQEPSVDVVCRDGVRMYWKRANYIDRNGRKCERAEAIGVARRHRDAWIPIVESKASGGAWVQGGNIIDLLKR